MFSSSIEWGIKSAGRKNVPLEQRENSERLFSFAPDQDLSALAIALRNSMMARHTNASLCRVGPAEKRRTQIRRRPPFLVAPPVGPAGARPVAP
jgi:hypothetical protein